MIRHIFESAVKGKPARPKACSPKFLAALGRQPARGLPVLHAAVALVESIAAEQGKALVQGQVFLGGAATEAEICEQWPSVLPDQNVRGFEVPVDHASVVGMGDGAKDHTHGADCVFDGQPSLGQGVAGQGLAVYELKGQVPMGFLCLKAGVETSDDKIVTEVIDLVRQRIGPVVAFKRAVIVKRLPKTRSGKIMRRILRKIAE